MRKARGKERQREGGELMRVDLSREQRAPEGGLLVEARTQQRRHFQNVARHGNLLREERRLLQAGLLPRRCGDEPRGVREPHVDRLGQPVRGELLLIERLLGGCSRLENGETECERGHLWGHNATH